MEWIGIRELRQHASRYVARVRSGESLVITDRGEAVALLVPKPKDTWAEMIATGAVVPPVDEETSPGDEDPLDIEFDASAELVAIRDQER